MSSSDDSLDDLEDQLAGAERTLSAVGALSAAQAERVGQRMDRLASQLLEVSPPPSIGAVHARLGTSPAALSDFDSLAGEMDSADAEG